MGEELRILMLEDEPTDVELEQRELRRAGLSFASRTAVNREGFVAGIVDFQPDLILADYSLPGFDGLSALTIAREMAPGVPFIFVTGVMGEEFAIDTLHQGAADYVLKTHLAKLAPAVNRALREAEERHRRRTAEVDLAESEERFRKIAESALDGLVIADADGVLTYWNAAAGRMFGYSQEEALGRRMHELLAPTRYCDAYEQGWPGFAKTGEGRVVGTTFEVDALRKDGTEFPVELSVSAVAIKGCWHAIAIVRDISERKAAEQALKRSNRFLRTMSRCNETLVRAVEEQALLDNMCRVVVEVGEFPMAWVGYVEENEKKSVRPVAMAGEHAVEYVCGLAISWEDEGRESGPTARACRTGQIQMTSDMALDADAGPWRERALAFGYRSRVALPLKVNGRVLGALSIYAAEPGAFGEGELALLAELAEDLAFGIGNLRARAEQEASARKLEKSLEDTIQAIATTIETRDPYTAGHQRRVAQLAAAIAREMGLPESRVTGVQRGAEIHDIGKVYVPAEILSRPGRLSEIEFGLIKIHPQVGHDIIKDIDFPWPVAAMIVQHHERLDGSGYPKALKGEEIVLEARILAVADVVDAMTSHRPYRAALGVEAALHEISRNSGILYDTSVVEACIRLIRDKDFTFA